MTTFTSIPDSETPSISVNHLHTLARIDDNTYGGFTEHMGRCIYGGIYDPGSPLSDARGFRVDVIAAMRELNVPVVRYPGGNFVATYHWQDGIGPRELRPKRRDLAWGGAESNAFGTDEFMAWCDAVGAEPYLALNFGTGSLDEALGWLEYCNADGDTYYANLRRANGRKKPYNVRYWALGNEVWGPWQVGQMTKEDYATKAYQWAKALKLLDPSIKLVLCGETGHSMWDAHVLKECVKWDVHGLGNDSATKSLIDMHSIHIYTAAGGDHLKNVTAPRSAERAITIAAALIDLARISNNVPPSVPRQRICFDEWNVWDPSRAPGEAGAEERYTLSDALALAVFMNGFVRQSAYVGMANLAQSVNVISPLMTHAEGLTKQTTWWPLLLYSRHVRGTNLAVHVRCGEYRGETQPAWMRGVGGGSGGGGGGGAGDEQGSRWQGNVGGLETPWLDVCAALGDDGFVNLAVVNIDPERAWKTRVDGVAQGAKVQVHTVTGAHVNVVNTLGDDGQVGVKESVWDVKESGDIYAFPKHSLTLLRWKTS